MIFFRKTFIIADLVTLNIRVPICLEHLYYNVLFNVVFAISVLWGCFPYYLTQTNIVTRSLISVDNCFSFNKWIPVWHQEYVDISIYTLMEHVECKGH